MNRTIFIIICMGLVLSCNSPNKRNAECSKASDTTEKRDVPSNKGMAAIDAKDSAGTSKDSTKHLRDTVRQQVVTVIHTSNCLKFGRVYINGRIKTFSIGEAEDVTAAGNTVYWCDLSYRGRDTMPDLSKYNIVHLDLSHNKIGRNFSLARLPQTLETLNLSYNRLGEGGSKELQTLSFRGEWSKRFPKLKVLNVSHNKLRAIYFPESAERIDASHNRLECFLPAWETHEKAGNLHYLDLSHNPKLRPGEFSGAVDTLITEGCMPDTI